MVLPSVSRLRFRHRPSRSRTREARRWLHRAWQLTCLLVGTTTPLLATTSIWEQMAELNLDAVRREAGSPEVQNNPHAQLAAAVALLNRQPKTASNVEAASNQLESLATNSTQEDVRPWATYFWARAAQLHEVPSRPAEAAARYRQLAHAAPRHPAAQRGLVKLIVLLVYDHEVEPSRQDGFAAAVELLPSLHDPGAHAEARLVLGRAAVFFKLPDETALEHLEIALRTGVANPTVRASTLVSIGELAARNGRHGQALDRYRQFLAENERDQRVNDIRRLVAELESKGRS